MKTNFYEFSQNNTGGSFDVDGNVCHRLFIEANSIQEANDIAESLGCYWDGVDKGMDCPCCGDRWYTGDKVDLDTMNTNWGGYTYEKWLKGETDEEAIQNIKSRYPDAKWSKELTIDNKYGSKQVIGKMLLDNIEQYAQILADLYGWTTPECRIFYKNGEIKEIFS